MVFQPDEIVFQPDKKLIWHNAVNPCFEYVSKVLNEINYSSSTLSSKDRCKFELSNCIIEHKVWY